MSVRYRRTPGATERKVGSALFLASPTRGTLFRVNETVAAFWALLADPVSEEEALAVFVEAFPRTPRRSLEQSVRTMVQDLLEEDLIRPEDGDQSTSPKRAQGQKR